jgi:trehalose 2-sulfotransferase
MPCSSGRGMTQNRRYDLTDIDIKISYFICSTPRTGSTLLCECLTRTGVAGKPGEHFYHGQSPDRPAGDDIPGYAGYVREVCQATATPNGVFGTKLNTLNDFARRLATIPGYEQASIHTAIAGLFPNPHFIWLTRRNKVRQAVSHWLAIQSGRWHSPETAANHQPEYRFEAINSLVDDIVIREAGWDDFFSANGIKPHIVIYEDFTDRLAATVQGILDYCNIQESPQLNFETTMNQRLADSFSEEWVQRFRHEKQKDWWTRFW